MKSETDHPPNETDDGKVATGVRTLSDAKIWLAKLAENGAARVEIKEPHRIIGGGLLIVTASLARADGARVGIEVYCYDDRQPVPAGTDLLFPLPASGILPGTN